MSCSKVIKNCTRCRLDKFHAGLGMCSACLRRTKRETKPRFYLGTCFSEMSRRVKTFDPIRPRYFGLEICERDEFKDRFENDEDFLRLYKGWQDSGFQRRFSPSIDRIDSKKGYTLDNIEFIIHTENSVKDNKMPVKITDKKGVITTFDSRKGAANFLGIHDGNMKKLIEKGFFNDYKLEGIKK